VPHHSLKLKHPTTGRPLRIAPNDSKAYGKWYRSLSHEERMKVIAEQRKRWYDAMAARTASAAMEAEGEAEATA